MPVERVSASSAAAAETARAAQADRDASRAADNAKADARQSRQVETRNSAPDITGAIIDSQG